MQLIVDKVKPFTMNDNSSLIPLYVLQLTCLASDIIGPYKLVSPILNCVPMASPPSLANTGGSRTSKKTTAFWFSTIYKPRGNTHITLCITFDTAFTCTCLPTTHFIYFIHLLSVLSYLTLQFYV